VVVAGLDSTCCPGLVPGVITGVSEMRMKPLPMATVATQTDACSEDGSHWDLLSLTSLVTNDDDDVDRVVGYVPTSSFAGNVRQQGSDEYPRDTSV